LPVAAEFLCYPGILWNSVLASNKGTNMRHIWSFAGGHTVCIRDFTMKYTTAECRLGHNGRNVETTDLSLSDIFQVYLVDICISQLQLLATNTAYLVGFRGP